MKTIGNVLWLVFAGLGTALGWLLWAALLAVTVVGRWSRSLITRSGRHRASGLSDETVKTLDSWKRLQGLRRRTTE